MWDAENKTRLNEQHFHDNVEAGTPSNTRSKLTQSHMTTAQPCDLQTVSQICNLIIGQLLVGGALKWQESSK